MRPQRSFKKPAVGRRPKSFKSDMDTRAAILAAARHVFARRGVDGTSVREVAQAAKVNNAMIYYYFKDKVELYRAVLADSFAAMDRIWDNKLFQRAAPVRKKIQKYIEEFIRFQHANEDLRRILSMEFACCGDNRKWLADKFFTYNYEKLSGILKHGMRSGELKKFNTASAISTLVGMIVHSFILKPIAEVVTGRNLNLSVPRFGAFVTGLFFDGLGMKGRKVRK